MVRFLQFFASLILCSIKYHIPLCVVKLVVMKLLLQYLKLCPGDSRSPSFDSPVPSWHWPFLRRLNHVQHVFFVSSSTKGRQVFSCFSIQFHDGRSCSTLCHFHHLLSVLLNYLPITSSHGQCPGVFFLALCLSIPQLGENALHTQWKHKCLSVAV